VHTKESPYFDEKNLCPTGTINAIGVVMKKRGTCQYPVSLAAASNVLNPVKRNTDLFVRT